MVLLFLSLLYCVLNGCVRVCVANVIRCALTVVCNICLQFFSVKYFLLLCIPIFTIYLHYVSRSLDRYIKISSF